MTHTEYRRYCMLIEATYRSDPLFNNLRKKRNTNRPYCLYRRPASRQARKPANDRNTLDGCSMVKRQNRVNDPACNAPRESQRQKGETTNRISGPDSLGWERRTSCTLPHSIRAFRAVACML